MFMARLFLLELHFLMWILYLRLIGRSSFSSLLHSFLSLFNHTSTAMRNFDFPAKARWREWQRRQIQQHPIKLQPKFRKALLLDPQLLETEMLESTGYRAGNITIVERDPNAFAELRERNEARKREGKETVILVKTDLYDFFADMVLGKRPHIQFHHISLDMLCQMSSEYLRLISLISAGAILADQALFFSNLQAKREPGQALENYDRLWNFSEALREAQYEDRYVPLSERLRARTEASLVERGELSSRRGKGADLKELRYSGRSYLEFLNFSIFSGGTASGSLYHRFGDFISSHKGEAEWLPILQSPFKDQEHLTNFLRFVSYLEGITSNLLIYERRSGLVEVGRGSWVTPMANFYYPLKYYCDGHYDPIVIRIYEYLSSSTPMLASFHCLERHTVDLNRSDVALIQRKVFTLLGQAMDGLSFTPPELFPREFNPKTYRGFHTTGRFQIKFGTYRIIDAIDHLEVDTNSARVRPKASTQALHTETPLDPSLAAKYSPDPSSPASFIAVGVPFLVGGEREEKSELESLPTSQIPQSLQKLTTKDQVREIFVVHSEWNVAALRANYDVSSFTSQQLAALLSWSKPDNGLHKGRTNGLQNSPTTGVFNYQGIIFAGEGDVANQVLEFINRYGGDPDQIPLSLLLSRGILRKDNI